MTYVVLARKWRPQQFGDVLGQEHVTQTLTNAIAAGRIAHAFLLSGPRGVGKTSAARILAKALCCVAAGGPTASPCGTCTQCVQITEGRSTDVFEIDAASHTGVDNVREIIDNVRYLPSSARFKIYVIDEVHMLSSGAFNALLKTLEEPPPHVKFILATTDVHKVPVTILSRCQRYDFRRISSAAIADRLSSILRDEGVAHDPSCLTLVAREADGSMRDAQSLLEQVLAYAAERPLDARLVREALGVVDGALVAATFDALLERRPAAAVDAVASVYERGLDLVRFADALVEHARDLLVAKVVRDPKAAIDRPRDEIDQLVVRAKAVDAKEIERLFEVLSRTVEEVGRSPHPRFALEVALASLADEPPRISLESLLRELQRIEGLVAGKVPPKVSEPHGPRGGGPRPAPVEQAHRSADPEPSRPPSRADFPAFVDLVKRRRPALAATLAQVRPLRFGSDGVALQSETAFDQQKLEERETRGYLEEILRELFGRLPPLEIGRGKASADETGKRTLSEVADAERTARVASKIEKAKDAPAVRAVSEKLGGEIAEVRVIDE
jgi:DNA polymerase-3 subunit gamma/tau